MNLAPVFVVGLAGVLGVTGGPAHAGVVTKDMLLQLAERGVGERTLVDLVKKECVDFDVDSDNILELSDKLTPSVLDAITECRSKASSETSTAKHPLEPDRPSTKPPAPGAQPARAHAPPLPPVKVVAPTKPAKELPRNLAFLNEFALGESFRSVREKLSSVGIPILGMEIPEGEDPRLNANIPGVMLHFRKPDDFLINSNALGWLCRKEPGKSYLAQPFVDWYTVQSDLWDELVVEHKTKGTGDRLSEFAQVEMQWKDMEADYRHLLLPQSDFQHRFDGAHVGTILTFGPHTSIESMVFLVVPESFAYRGARKAITDVILSGLSEAWEQTDSRMFDAFQFAVFLGSWKDPGSSRVADLGIAEDACLSFVVVTTGDSPLRKIVKQQTESWTSWAAGHVRKWTGTTTPESHPRSCKDLYKAWAH